MDKVLKKQITDALAGNGQLPKLTRQQLRSLIKHYKQRVGSISEA